MFSKTFWKKAAERAVKTAGQFGLAAWGATVFTDVSQVLPTGQTIGLAALSGAVLSVLTSIGSGGIGPSDDPSVV